MLAHLSLYFSMDGGRLSSSCPKSYIVKCSHFPFTTSGLMIDCVAPVSIVKMCCLPKHGNADALSRRLYNLECKYCLKAEKKKSIVDIRLTGIEVKAD